MNPEIKGRWLEALRSGDYPQTRRRLADDNGYCCLGVLCEIAVEDGIVTKGTAGGSDDGIVYTSATDSADFEFSVLPVAVFEWAGMTGPNPGMDLTLEDIPEHARDIAFEGTGYNLADLNDTLRMDFSEIAFVIEEQL